MLDENDTNMFKVNKKIIYSYDGEDEDEDKYYDECYKIEGEIFEKFEKYVYVKIFIDSRDEKFIARYDEHIREHNKNLMSKHSFELLCPNDMVLPSQYENVKEGEEDGEIIYNNPRLDFDVKCQCHMISSHETTWQPITFMVHPIPTNTLPNIFRPIETINPNYIGNLRVELDCRNNEEINLDKYDTIYQLMNIGLDPLYVDRVQSLEDLYTTKLRV